MNFFQTLGKRFLAARDFNAKHTLWGSRLIQPKGRNLARAMKILALDYISTGESTYWPFDAAKIPDLIDFGIINDIPKKSIDIKSLLELSSDHSSIIFLLL